MVSAELMKMVSAMTHRDVAVVIAPSDPLVILDGIKQFGLAADGSDLRDLRAAFGSQAKALSDAESELGIARQINHDLTDGISGTLRKDRIEALESSLAEARRVIERQTSALRPLGSAVYNDNGDMTIGVPLVTSDQCAAAYWAVRAGITFLNAAKEKTNAR